MGSEVCPGCGAEFDAVCPVRYIAEGVTRNCEVFRCGSYFVTIDGERQLNQVQDCSFADRDARIAALSEELERVKAGMQQLAIACVDPCQVSGDWIASQIERLLAGQIL